MYPYACVHAFLCFVFCDTVVAFGLLEMCPISVPFSTAEFPCCQIELIEQVADWLIIDNASFEVDISGTTNVLKLILCMLLEWRGGADAYCFTLQKSPAAIVGGHGLLFCRVCHQRERRSIFTL